MSGFINTIKKAAATTTANTTDASPPRCISAPEVDATMKFSITPSSGESGFAQWQSAMKMVARLPGGIPPEFRRTLWLNLADRHLAARGVDWPMVERNCLSEWSHPADAELGVQIVKDLHRTGCSMFCGENGQENQALLKKVLLAYARWNKSVGYCQGFNMLAALILQVTERREADALKLMIYLIEGVLPDSYFADSLRGLSVDMAVFRELLRTRLPRLSRHLDKLQRAAKDGTTSYEPPLTNVFTMQWFLTLFCNCLPQETVLRVWDLILLEGNEILLRTALAIWQALADRIIDVRSADEFYCIMGVLTREMLEFGFVDANSLIKTIVCVGPLTELKSLRDHYFYNINPWAAGPSPVSTSLLENDEKQLKTYPKERLMLDIGVLKKQYAKLKQRQRQAHIIFSAAVSRQPQRPAPVAMNHLLLGKSALVSVRRLGPPQGAIPPPRKQTTTTTIPTPVETATTTPTTLHWKDAPRQSSSSSSSDTELCDDPDNRSSDDEEKNDKIPRDKSSIEDEASGDTLDKNLMTADNTSSFDGTEPEILNLTGGVDSKEIIQETVTINSTFDHATDEPFQLNENIGSDDGFDFEKFLEERIRCLKQSTIVSEPVSEVTDTSNEIEKISQARKNSERALEIIQENSLILHRILQCQRYSPIPIEETALVIPQEGCEANLDEFDKSVSSETKLDHLDKDISLEIGKVNIKEDDIDEDMTEREMQGHSKICDNSSSNNDFDLNNEREEEKDAATKLDEIICDILSKSKNTQFYKAHKSELNITENGSKKTWSNLDEKLYETQLQNLNDWKGSIVGVNLSNVCDEKSPQFTLQSNPFDENISPTALKVFDIQSNLQPECIDTDISSIKISKKYVDGYSADDLHSHSITISTRETTKPTGSDVNSLSVENTMQCFVTDDTISTTEHRTTSLDNSNNKSKINEAEVLQMHSVNENYSLGVNEKQSRESQIEFSNNGKLCDIDNTQNSKIDQNRFKSNTECDLAIKCFGDFSETLSSHEYDLSQKFSNIASTFHKNYDLVTKHPKYKESRETNENFDCRSNDFQSIREEFLENESQSTQTKELQLDTKMYEKSNTINYQQLDKLEINNLRYENIDVKSKDEIVPITETINSISLAHTIKTDDYNVGSNQHDELMESEEKVEKCDENLSSIHILTNSYKPDTSNTMEITQNFGNKSNVAKFEEIMTSKINETISNEAIDDFDKRSKYRDILAYSKNLDKKYNTLIEKNVKSEDIPRKSKSELASYVKSPLDKKEFTPTLYDPSSEEQIKKSPSKNVEFSNQKSPNHVYNPFPVKLSSRQNKDVAVRLGLYKK